MNTNRIKEIQKAMGYPDSASVMLALKQVWNECEQEQTKEIERLNKKLDKWEVVKIRNGPGGFNA